MIDSLRSALAGRYEVQREIGAGGMATVFLARDLRHDRLVALKLLNPDLGALLGPERFLSEIRVTANLQHPNLLPLFDSGEAEGHLFYVMPFVDGETLRARLDREKQLPIDEAIHISVAIANALEYAHSHGVIHRDLKPENVLMQSGQPVIADFGIALAVSQAGGNRITQTGLSLGTPQYMSPEQATGDRIIDRRSDIYSLAAMTYEMLSGEPPHTGNTSQAVIARLLTEKPRSIRTSRAAVPEHVEDAITHALEKLPADRFSSAREYADALQGRGATAAHSHGTTSRTTVKSSRWRDPVVVTLAGVATTAVVFAVIAAARPARQSDRVVRYTYSGSDSTRTATNWPWPATISPDGSAMVYTVNVASGTALYALRTNQTEPVRVPGTDGANSVIFSHDGNWLAFQQRGSVRKVRLDGTMPITVTAGGAANGMEWSSRDEIFLGAEGGSMRGIAKVNSSGGELKSITTPDTVKGDSDHLWPIASPDGKRIYFVIWSGSQQTARLATVDADGAEVAELGVRGLRVLAVIDRTLLYVEPSGMVMGVPLSRNGTALTGRPIPVHDPVPVLPVINGNSDVFISRGGALVYSRGAVTTRLMSTIPKGAAQSIMRDPKQFLGLALSQNESQIALTIVDENNRADIWIYDKGTATLSRLTSALNATAVQWFPDGQRVVYLAPTDSTRFGIWEQATTGGSARRLILRIPSLSSNVVVAPDGKSAVFSAYVNTSWNVYRVALDSAPRAVPLLDSRAMEAASSFSPDGKWLAAASDESGSFEVFAYSYPNPTSRVQISAGGGTEGVWARDGSRVYYRSGDALMAARVTFSPSLRVTSRDTVIDRTTMSQNTIGAAYDVARDGRILGMIPERGDYRLVVVPDWKPELRRRLAEAHKP